MAINQAKDPAERIENMAMDAVRLAAFLLGLAVLLVLIRILVT